MRQSVTFVDGALCATHRHQNSSREPVVRTRSVQRQDSLSAAYIVCTLNVSARGRPRTSPARVRSEVATPRRGQQTFEQKRLISSDCSCHSCPDLKRPGSARAWRLQLPPPRLHWASRVAFHLRGKRGTRCVASNALSNREHLGSVWNDRFILIQLPSQTNGLKLLSQSVSQVYWVCPRCGVTEDPSKTTSDVSSAPKAATFIACTQIGKLQARGATERQNGTHVVTQKEIALVQTVSAVADPLSTFHESSRLAYTNFFGEAPIPGACRCPQGMSQSLQPQSQNCPGHWGLRSRLWQSIGCLPVSPGQARTKLSLVAEWAPTHVKRHLSAILPISATPETSRFPILPETACETQGGTPIVPEKEHRTLKGAQFRPNLSPDIRGL